MIRYLIYMFVMILPMRVSADPDSLFEVANQFAAQHAYEPALERYEMLLEREGISVEVLYNAGLTAQKAGSTGKARLYYERAKLFDPHNEAILNNLKILKDELDITGGEIQPFFLRRWFTSFYLMLPVGGWLWLGGLLLWTGLALFVLGALRPGWSFRRIAIPAGIVSMLTGASLLLLAWQRSEHIHDNHKVVVMQEKAGLMTAPDSLSTLQFRLTPGETGLIQEELNDHYKLRLYNGEEGWVRTDQVEKISP